MMLQLLEWMDDVFDCFILCTSFIFAALFCRLQFAVLFVSMVVLRTSQSYTPCCSLYLGEWSLSSTHETGLRSDSELLTSAEDLRNTWGFIYLN